ncbi:alpha/beta fold hydrolase [Burkholderia ambifaria]|uniref:Alpha/beta hydrolase n=1 Tax=Burkholderia ambifaria TaxID=152480 RepID=A0AA41EDI3_9BURK|nr:alpha/beta hydrolase [Burkholderia ambifaria]MBR8132980.1 alpha/beta hydrolase [Burkholderia ambifaria]PRD97269.1 alpha/beta hydrolase [Burkholderia ambifaria]UEP47130.1 alpha/beta hydrolase [Burkholderia ambifaria]
MKDIIHFSHANGFPASTYRTIFAELADDYELRYIERIGHDRRYPVTRDWPHLVEQLLDDIGGRYERPVWLVGHSLGGYLSLMAALKKPQWVRGVVMIDSPIIAGWRAGALRASQWAGLDERLSPAAATRNRRTRWTSRDEVWRHFHEKPAFARWDERMLSDYIDYGIPQAGADGERTLAFDRQVEYLIYRTLPHTLGPRLAHGTPVPLGFLAGTRSREVRQVGLDATRRAARGRIEWLEGSHLFPMERPIETARALQRMLNSLKATEGGVPRDSVALAKRA